MQVDVVCALEEEAAAVRTVLTDRGLDRVSVTVTGMGKVNAAAVTAATIDRATDLVLAVGVCGRLVPGDHDTYWLSRAVQHDYGALRDGTFHRYSPGSLPLGPADVVPYEAIDDPGVGLPHATIASGDVFVEDAAGAAAIATDLGATLVDMEVGAIAQTATLLGVPWAGIKSVTDDADDSSATDFAANLAAAATRAAHATAHLLTLL